MKCPIFVRDSYNSVKENTMICNSAFIKYAHKISKDMIQYLSVSMYFGLMHIYESFGKTRHSSIKV